MRVSQKNSQRVNVLLFFARHERRSFTPEEVRDKAFDTMQPPLTSVRRALSELADMGLLVKTNVCGVGDYGRRVHTWRLSAN